MCITVTHFSPLFYYYLDCCYLCPDLVTAKPYEYNLSSYSLGSPSCSPVYTKDPHHTKSTQKKKKRATKKQPRVRKEDNVSPVIKVAAPVVVLGVIILVYLLGRKNTKGKKKAPLKQETDINGKRNSSNNASDSLPQSPLVDTRPFTHNSKQ